MALSGELERQYNSLFTSGMRGLYAGELDTAACQLREAEALAALLGDTERHVDALVPRAFVLHSQGFYELADTMLQQAAVLRHNSQHQNPDA